MAKVLVLYYSSYGHVEQMADAVAEGARSAGAQVDVRRVAETAPQAVVEGAGFKTDTAHPVLTDPAEMEQYDAIIVGAPALGGKPVGGNRFYGANDPRRNSGLSLGY